MTRPPTPTIEVQPLHQGAPHESARKHVSGQARYVDDLPAPGAVHGVIVRSPVAHGVVRGLTTPPLEDGVLAVLTAADIPGDNAEHAAAPRTPSPPAFDTAAASAGTLAPPIPARRIGYSIPRISQMRLLSAIVLPSPSCAWHRCQRVISAPT